MCSINLSSEIKEHLPLRLLKLMKEAGEKAEELGQRLYLVGGGVRDLLLQRPNFDLDLVVEGDALKLAKCLAETSRVKLVVHPRFGTAKLSYTDFSLDLATARLETYAKPGALPMVIPGTIIDDLIRRDFSINAMAICLTPERCGELIDPYNGKNDLENRLIRILYQRSFVDDATRIFRALRYEQRLGFQLESNTAKLLQRNVSMINTISGNRIRHELELILKENRPEPAIQRADELRVLEQLHPSLKGNDWLANKFEQVRQLAKPSQILTLYLCILIYPLSEEENEQFLYRLNFPKRSAQAMRHALNLKAQLPDLAKPHLKPSDVYQLLHNYTSQAVQANAIASDSPVINQQLQLYLNKLHYVKPLLNGEALKRLGVPPGPQLGRILQILHVAKLNGKVKTKKQEEELVRSWLAGNS